MARIGRPPVPVERRFAARIEPGPGDCWNWQGFLDRDGYGQFTDANRRNVRAHRWSYEHHIGPIPSGLVIDHLCRNRACVNPWHMEPVPAAVNTRRGLAPTAINGRKSSCKRGHPLTGPNLVAVPGGRACRTCRVEATRRWRAKNKKAA